jgi:Cytochrome P450
MASCNTQILGHFIPKGTEIVLHIGHAGLQNSKPSEGDGNEQRPSHRPGVPKSLWHGDGESFNPDRWLDERGGFSPNAGVALPFGAGPRKCYGYKLAVSYIYIRCMIYKLLADLTDEACSGGADSQVLHRATLESRA